MKILIFATALLGFAFPALAGQTCVTRNGYTYCSESYGGNQNCARINSSSFVCY